MAEDRRTPKKFEVVEHDGRMVRKYPDGTLRGEHGHIVKGGLPSHLARERGAKRREQGAQAARRALRSYTQSQTVQEGLEKLVGTRVEVAMTDKGRAGNDAARFVAIMAGAYAVNQSVSVSGAVHHIPEPPRLPQAYLDALEKLVRDEGVLEGEVNDNEG